MGGSEFFASKQDLVQTPPPIWGLGLFLGLHVLPTFSPEASQTEGSGTGLWGCPRSTHLCCWLPASPQCLQWLVRSP